MATLDQRLERIVINLKVISKLEPGQRLLFKNKSITIRNHYPFVTPVIRRVAGESRTDVTEGLRELLDDINRLVNDYSNSQELQHPTASDYDREATLAIIMSLNRLRIEMPMVYNTANKGLNAAIDTYSDDPETSAKIEGAIDNLKFISRKVSIFVSDMNRKYGFDTNISGGAGAGASSTEEKTSKSKSSSIDDDDS